MTKEMEIPYSDKVRLYTKWFVSILFVLISLFVLVLILSFVQNKDYSIETATLGLIMNAVSAFFSSKVWYEYVKDSKKSEEKQNKLKEEWVNKYNDDPHMMNVYDADSMWFDHKKSRKEIGLLHTFAIITNVGFVLFNLWRLYRGI